MGLIATVLAVRPIVEEGRLYVPMRAESETGVIGDGMVPITPDHPDWDAWVAKLTGEERERLTSRARGTEP